MKLNDFTEVFDDCGAYDGTDKMNVVPKGSEYPLWKNALNY